jgi:hypothetical protein
MSLKFAGVLVGLALLAGPVAAQTATYDTLSSGDRKHVDALYGAQQPPNGAAALTRDDIAARKGDTGWGNVFKDLKAQGYYPDAKNLGDVVSAYHHQQNALRKEQHRAEKAERKAEKAEWKAQKAEWRAERPDKPERPHKPEKVR